MALRHPISLPLCDALAFNTMESIFGAPYNAYTRANEGKCQEIAVRVLIIAMLMPLLYSPAFESDLDDLLILLNR